MAAGNYFTTATPQVLAGLMMQSETRVRIGTSRLYTVGALDTTSALYLAYGASIGLTTANSFDLGEVASLGFEHVPSFEKPDVANVLESSIEVLTEEEVTISIGIMQFDPRIFQIMIRTGTMYTVGNEVLITAGAKCGDTRRPMELAALNIGCNAPAAPVSTLVGISAIIITIYDVACTSGLPWSDMLANELNVLDSEWTAYPVSSKAAGNRLFSVYMF